MDGSSTRETRGPQMYPALAPSEIDRMRRFGELTRFGPADVIVREGDTKLGIAVVLSGDVDVAHHGVSDLAGYAHRHRAGSFIGELSQLSGRPWLAAATAVGTAEVLLITPERLRALMIADADLGERLMRALILRRVGLLESGGGGPIAIGLSNDAAVLRLQTFLARNGIRTSTSIPKPTVAHLLLPNGSISIRSRSRAPSAAEPQIPPDRHTSTSSCRSALRIHRASAPGQRSSLPPRTPSSTPMICSSVDLTLHLVRPSVRAEL